MESLLAIAVGVVAAGLLLTWLLTRPGPRSVKVADEKPKLWSPEDTTPAGGRSRTDRAIADVSHDAAKDRWAAIDWARRVMENKSRYVILDTETTGLSKTDEIIQLAVIDLDGNTLFNENVKPTKRKRMKPEAVEIHGLTMEALSNCPTFAELAEPLGRALGRKTVIAYNGKFDNRMYAQTYMLAGGFQHMGDWDDIMVEFSKYVGRWSDYWHDYEWQSLPGGSHSALGDCLATLEVLRRMAASTE